MDNNTIFDSGTGMSWDKSGWGNYMRNAFFDAGTSLNEQTRVDLEMQITALRKQIATITAEQAELNMLLEKYPELKESYKQFQTMLALHKENYGN